MAALFIVNPAARGGRGSRAEARIEAAVASLDVRARVVRTKAPGGAESLAAEGLRDGFSPVVAVGGDGTVHEVVNGLLRARLSKDPLEPAGWTPPQFGVIPTGSGNDFARAAGLPADIEGAVQLILEGPRRRIDAARCGDRAFVNAASVGFDAEVAAIVANASSLLRSSGPLLYPLALARALPRYTVRPMRIELDGSVLERRALLVAVANGPYYGGGFRICPEADPGDGWLDVLVLGDLTLLRAIRLLPRLRAGTHIGAAQVELFRARVAKISNMSAPVQLDGEPAGTSPSEFRLMAGALSLCGAEDPSSGRRVQAGRGTSGRL